MGAVVDSSTNSGWSISKLAIEFNTTRDTVRKKIAQARVKPCGRALGHDVYALIDVAPLLVGGNSISYDGEFDPNLLQPKDRKDWYDGESKRIQILRESRELLTYDDVSKTWAETLKKIMLTLDTIVDVVERDVGLSAEQIKHIQTIIDRQRETLYNDLCTQEQETSSEMSPKSSDHPDD